jgi:hypothetical protein
MARPFLLIWVSRDEEERFDLFIVAKGVPRPRRRREGSPRAPGHVCHADNGVHRSTTILRSFYIAPAALSNKEGPSSSTVVTRRQPCSWKGAN